MKTERPGYLLLEDSGAQGALVTLVVAFLVVLVLLVLLLVLLLAVAQLFLHEERTG